VETQQQYKKEQLILKISIGYPYDHGNEKYPFEARIFGI